MEEPEHFTAGAFITMANSKDITNFEGRIFLIIQAIDETTGVEMAASLMKNPKTVVDLFKTLHPWPNEVVQIDGEFLDNRFHIRKVTLGDGQ